MKTTNDSLEQYNVLWTTPSKNSSGSMPVGNGDIGLNVWCEENGDLLFYLGKTDSWGENGELLKLGRVRMTFSPNPFTPASGFRQELKLQSGEIVIEAGSAASPFRICIWVDAMQPVVRTEIESQTPISVQVALESWRMQPRVLEGKELPYGLGKGTPRPIVAGVDTILEPKSDSLRWYHRNTSSIWEDVLRAEKLEALLTRQKDPLLNLTFGGCIKGQGLIAAGSQTLRSVQPQKNALVSVYVLIEQTSTESQWLARLDALMSRVESVDLASARKAHCSWWRKFWDQSWMWVSGDEDADLASQSYALQRYVLACAGRGKFPIKFNGSIFNFDADTSIIDKTGLTYNADWRLWGSPYAWQNTRLIYWSMLNSGDFEMMKPLFEMYKNMLELGKEQSRTYFKHDGFFLIESTYFWGGYPPYDVEWNIKLDKEGLGVNPYIRYIWHGGLELVAMMLEYYQFTQDRRFLSDTLLPFAGEVVTFYDQHWKRDEHGKMQIDPSQAIEQFFDVKNPMTDVAGLRCVLSRLIALPQERVSSSQIAAWTKTLDACPDVPMIKEPDGNRLLPAERYDADSPKNVENPELYAVFPYRLYGIDKPDLATARRTYSLRSNKRSGGWYQDAIQAAMLGLTEDAKEFVVYNWRYKNAAVWQNPGQNWEMAVKECQQRIQPDIRFPGFWGPNYDWIPDQDQPSVTMIAMQKMLMQTDGKKIVLFPAWPKQWNVRFKLHAPYNTIIEGEFQNGEIKNIKTLPPERMQDIVLVES